MTHIIGPTAPISDTVAVRLKPRRRIRPLLVIIATAALTGGLFLLTDGNPNAALLGAWIVLAPAGLSRGMRGVAYGTAALLIGLLLLADGPAGHLGVVDAHTFFRHPYAQPGLTMSCVSAAVLMMRALRSGWGQLSAIGVLTRRRRLALLATAILVGGAWVVVAGTRPTADSLIQTIADDPARAPDSDQLEQLLLAVAREYESWGHAEGDMNWGYRFGPPLCRGPGGPTARVSDSADSATHGRKLYTIYARHRRSYLNLWMENRVRAWKPSTQPGTLVQMPPTGLPAQDLQSPVGQIIVKESFDPVAVGPAPENAESWGMRAVRQGTYYVPGRRGDLFVMAHVGEGVAGTDAGWVYGTVSADGKRATSVGRVQNCADCHRAAPYGRLFGLPWDQDW